MPLDHCAVKVLLADDNMVSRELVSSFLEKYGFQVFVARNGAEAVILARSHQFNLIILDLWMPELDGYAAAAQIKSENVNSLCLPAFLALTCDNSPEALKKCVDLGFVGLLVKPVSMVEFTSMVEKILKID